jgi:hypothetical protein
MPFFDFQCPNCQTVQNELCKHDAKIECNQCVMSGYSIQMNKLVSAPQCIQANFSPRYHPRRK